MFDWNGYYLGKIVDWHDAGISVLNVPPEIMLLGVIAQLYEQFIVSVVYGQVRKKVSSMTNTFLVVKEIKFKE